MKSDKRFLSFGKGGYRGFERILLDTLEFNSYEEALASAKGLQLLGYWTVLHEKI